MENKGFTEKKLTDLYGIEYSLHKITLKNGCKELWIGVENFKKQILYSDAKAIGINPDEIHGWITYPIPNDVLINPGFHLNREKAAELLQYLMTFVETGEI